MKKILIFVLNLLMSLSTAAMVVFAAEPAQADGNW